MKIIFKATIHGTEERKRDSYDFSMNQYDTMHLYQVKVVLQNYILALNSVLAQLDGDSFMRLM